MAKKEKKPKAAPTKAAKPAAKKPSEVLAEQVLVIMQKLKENGVEEVTSRLISDKLGLDKEIGRSVVRRAMKALEKDGKVVIERKAGTKRQYAYRLKE